MVRTLVLLIACWASLWAQANEAVPASADPQLEARMVAITSELRCLVCKNQTIADSHASLAEDLREEVRILLRKGQTDQQIRDYMTARYGDFVLYRPRVQANTLFLWFGPALLMLGGCVALGVVLWRRSRLADDQFEPDEDEAMPLGGGST